jgi:hypothetical protein
MTQLGKSKREARQTAVVVPFPQARATETRHKAAAALASCLETMRQEAHRAGLTLTAEIVGAALLALSEECRRG